MKKNTKPPFYLTMLFLVFLLLSLNACLFGGQGGTETGNPDLPIQPPKNDCDNCGPSNETADNPDGISMAPSAEDCDPGEDKNCTEESLTLISDVEEIYSLVMRSENIQFEDEESAFLIQENAEWQGALQYLNLQESDFDVDTSTSATVLYVSSTQSGQYARATNVEVSGSILLLDLEIDNTCQGISGNTRSVAILKVTPKDAFKKVKSIYVFKKNNEEMCE